MKYRPHYKWQEFIYSYFLANYQNIEYLAAKREFVDKTDDTVYNVLIFPIDLNANINSYMLRDMVDSICNDEKLKLQIFGDVQKKDFVIGQNVNDKSWYIKWSIIPMEDYEEMSESALMQIFNY